MAGETIRIWHPTVTTLISSGGTIANNTISGLTAALNLAALTPANYPNVRFVMSFTFTVAPVENSALFLIGRDLDIDGTNDAQIPEATFLETTLGYFRVNNVTTIQYAKLDVFDAPVNADYAIYNAATGQTVSAGCTLKAQAFTYGPLP